MKKRELHISLKHIAVGKLYKMSYSGTHQGRPHVDIYDYIVKCTFNPKDHCVFVFKIIIGSSLRHAGEVVVISYNNPYSVEFIEI